MVSPEKKILRLSLFTVAFQSIHRKVFIYRDTLGKNLQPNVKINLKIQICSTFLWINIQGWNMYFGIWIWVECFKKNKNCLEY